MPEAPTKEGQNLIIANLNKIFMTMMAIALAGLFAWGQNMSHLLNIQQTENQRLNDKIDGLQKEINDNEADILELQHTGEQQKDDIKTRIIKLEDFNLYKFQNQTK